MSDLQQTVVLLMWAVLVTGEPPFFMAIWLDLWDLTFWETVDFPLHPESARILQPRQEFVAEFLLLNYIILALLG